MNAGLIWTSPIRGGLQISWSELMEMLVSDRNDLLEFVEETRSREAAAVRG